MYNRHGSSPEFLGACACCCYSGGAVHAGGLWGVGVELTSGDDADAAGFPGVRGLGGL